jgi:hypothetical protein
MSKKLPAMIYVKIDSDIDDEYLVANVDASRLVEMGQKLKLGVYKLIEIQTAEGIAKLTKNAR